MNYLISFQGLMSKNTETFKNLMESLIKNNNQIFIVTGERLVKIQKKINDLGFQINIHFNQILSISDYVIQHIPEHEIEYDLYNNVWIEDDLWAKTKGKICKKYKIDVVFDSCEEYLMYMPNSAIKFHIMK